MTCLLYTCRPGPRIPDTLVSERASRQAVQDVHRRLTRLVEKLHDIACGKDIKMFILVRAPLSKLANLPIPSPFPTKQH